MRCFFAVPLILIAACSQQPGNDTGNAVSNLAADNGANTGMAPIRPTSSPEPTPTPEQGAEGESGAAAASAVLDQYFRALSQGDYHAAWVLWDDSGARSGMSADDFAASFYKYRSYSAEIGTPGRIDASAGNRYVTISVVVTGTLKDGGRQFRLEGPVTLHRNADIPGTTAEDRSWRIWSSDLDARPAETPAVAELIGNAAN
ncbi:MAG: hypothetical protein CMN73_06695 [Sphingomonas sp.]|nr:hypothetical protein [Sphingomonas sp.]|tara:strand:+ start:1565 stop:2170 length:606 start_codon:yes stop_codon:yes gene_type:complete